MLNVARGRNRRRRPQGKYLVDDDGRIGYFVDPAINGRVRVEGRREDGRDDGDEVANELRRPQDAADGLIIDGILNQKLPWGLVLIGALIAVTLELAGVPSLPFAVGVYLPISDSLPIFVGGLIRWVVDKTVRGAASEAEAEIQPRRAALLAATSPAARSPAC